MIEKGIYTKKFTFKANDGSEDSIYLKPLPVKFLPKLFKVAGKFQGASQDDIMTRLDEDTMTDLSEIVYQAVKKSLPDEKDDVIDGFVSQHFMDLIGAVFEVNFNNKEK